ncbi:MAG: DUF2974 domain-containing protein [Erysipelotrichia bacterium]|nr:DUF2974 domain-containing protein [Erysipelotrichia bacterium]NCC54560.1 DUF2974 domain-containing protein [Erysipelotrichia bacterium]
MMENMLSYLHWRNDITFQERAFNEVDALILSQLAYVEWEGIVGSDPITLEKACQKFYVLHDDEDMKKRYSYSVRIPRLIKALQNTQRFKNVKLKNYETVFDEVKEIQYAAITFVLPDGTLFVAYRGTDTSMLGWKEDMKMTYLDEIPSHHLALHYLEHIFDDLSVTTSFFGLRRKMNYPKVYLGGHSKGGNLAMYAGICAKDIHEHIEKIFNFDGPGFRESFYEQHEYQQIINKIVAYLPQSSMIGRLLVHKEKRVIMQAYEKGLSQHDAFCWKAGYDGFVKADHLSEESNQTKQYIEEKLLSKSDEQKKVFIDLVFTMFDKLKINTINDLSELGIKQGVSGIKELSTMSSDERKFFIEVIRFLWLQSKAILFTKK